MGGGGVGGVRLMGGGGGGGVIVVKHVSCMQSETGSGVEISNG